MRAVFQTILILIVAVFSVVINFLISPYRDELDIEIPQVDPDALLVLRVSNATVVLCGLLLLILNRKSQSLFLRYAPILIVVYGVYNILKPV